MTRKKVITKDDHRYLGDYDNSRTTFDILRNRDSDGDGIPDSIDPAPTIVDDKYQYAKINKNDFEQLSDEIKEKIEYRNTDDIYVIRAEENIIKDIESVVQPIVPHKSNL